MKFAKFFEGFSNYPDELVVHAASRNANVRIYEHDSFENMDVIVSTYGQYNVVDFTFYTGIKKLVVYLEGGSDVK